MANPNGQGIRFPFPEYHGDPIKYPHESWDLYKISIDLAYKGAEKDFTEEAKTAHILSGLKGPARKYLTVNPRLMTMRYGEVMAELENRFNRTNVTKLLNLSEVTQQPGELVQDYAARLHDAVKVIKRQHDYVPLVEISPPSKEASRTDNSDDALVVGPAASESGENKDSSRTINASKIKTRAEVLQENDIYDEFRDSLLFVHFIRGLRPEFKVVVSAARPKTFKEALQVAEEHERYIEMYGGSQAHAHLISQSDSPLQILAGYTDPAIEKVAQQLQQLNLSTATDNKHQPRVDRGNIQDKTQCYYCGRFGHYARDCKSKARDINRMSQHADRPQAQPSMPHVHTVNPANFGQSSSAATQERLPSTRPGKTYYDSYRHRNDERGYDRNDRSDKPSHNFTRNSKNGERPPRGGLTIPSPVQKMEQNRTQSRPFRRS